MNKKEKTYISMRTTLATKIGDKLLPNFLNRDVYNSSVKELLMSYVAVQRMTDYQIVSCSNCMTC